MWAPVVALVQRWVTINRRGITMGVVSTGFGLGLATMGAVFPWVVGNFSWRYAWYFLGAMALACAFKSERRCKRTKKTNTAGCFA